MITEPTKADDALDRMRILADQLAGACIEFFEANGSEATTCPNPLAKEKYILEVVEQCRCYLQMFIGHADCTERLESWSKAAIDRRRAPGNGA